MKSKICVAFLLMSTSIFKSTNAGEEEVDAGHGPQSTSSNSEDDFMEMMDEMTQQTLAMMIASAQGLMRETKRRQRRRLQSMQLASVEVGVDGQTMQADNQLNQGDDLDQVLLNDVLSSLKHLEARTKNRRSLVEWGNECALLSTVGSSCSTTEGTTCQDVDGDFIYNYCLKSSLKSGQDCIFDQECVSKECDRHGQAVAYCQRNEGKCKCQ